MWQIHLSTGGVGRIPVKDGMSLHPSPRLHTDCMRTGQSRKKQAVVESQAHKQQSIRECGDALRSDLALVACKRSAAVKSLR